MITAVVGLNWGDEGKGRMVDYLATDADYVVRYHGGSNAGHTIRLDHGRFTLHSLPSSVFRPDVVSVLGPGMAVDLDSFLTELDELAGQGVKTERIVLSDNASVCFPFHRDLDAAEETRLSDRRYGSTRRGISPAYGDRVMKKTLLVRELFDDQALPARLEAVLDWADTRLRRIYGAPPLDRDATLEWARGLRDRLAPHVADVTTMLGEAYQAGAAILAEGQLGALRDVYYGVYPYTTSSTCLAGHAPVGIGVPWARVGRTVGVTKAFASCVGAGPFVTEWPPERADRLREQWGEYGATTARPRRLGAFDAVATRYGALLQGADELALTNLDQLSGTGELQVCVRYRRGDDVLSRFSPDPAVLSACTPEYRTLPGWDDDITAVRRFEDLPAAAREYVTELERELATPIRYVSVGAHRDALIDRGPRR